MEVPLMISLTKFLWRTRGRFPRKKVKSSEEIARAGVKR
jgi:hypothetical protein